tara:strand:+ start:20204 stop:20638 length:435 start_codon:yes stop_codon:yes gene_type:complete
MMKADPNYDDEADDEFWDTIELGDRPESALERAPALEPALTPAAREDRAYVRSAKTSLYTALAAIILGLGMQALNWVSFSRIQAAEKAIDASDAEAGATSEPVGSAKTDVKDGKAFSLATAILGIVVILLLIIALILLRRAMRG